MKVYLKRQRGFEEFDVESLRLDRNSHFLKLKSIDTLNEADFLVGSEVYVPEESFDPLEDGTYYHFQIIGSAVLTKEGEMIGRVKGLLPVAGSPLLVVERDGREVFIPFTAAICPRVDLLNKEIRIDPPDGLLDLNEI